MLQVQIFIPLIYQSDPETGPSSQTEVIKIEGLQEKIGVKLITKANTVETPFTAIPDETLKYAFEQTKGSLYRLADLGI